MQNNGNQNRMTFEQIDAEAKKRRGAELSESAKYSKAAFDAQHERKNPDDIKYSIGSFINDTRLQHFTELSKRLDLLAEEYGGGKLSEYESRHNALVNLPEAEQSNESKAEAEYIGSCVEHMKNIIDAQRDVKTFLSKDIRRDDSPARHASRLNNAKAALEKCLRSSDEMLLYSPDELHVLDSYAEIAEMSAYMDSLQTGLLVVPKPGTGTENGKKVHFVDAVGKSPEITLSPGDEAAIKKLNGEKLFIDKSDTPLFTFPPDPDDITQGGLGDCYMLATLMAVARQDPMLILNSMCENEDPETHKKTVTVRFFNDLNEPVYVTVDKSVPATNMSSFPDSPSISEPYSMGELWVKIIEKAYTASGLHKNRLAQAEKGTLKSSYHDIKGGNETTFAARMLGGSEVGDAGKNISFYPRAEDTVVRENGQYSDDQRRRFDALEKACNDGLITTCGTVSKDVFTSRKFKKEDFYNGIEIIPGHAYSLIGTERGKDNKLYMIIRNPYNQSGTYLDELDRHDSSAHGYAKLELNEFDGLFEESNIHEFSFTAEKKDRIADEKAFCKRYSGALRDIELSLRATDSIFLHHRFGNSEEFSNFMTAAEKASACAASQHPDPETLKASMESLFGAAEAYERHCRDKNLTSESSFRDLERLKLAKIVKEFAADHHAGREKEFSFTELNGRIDIATSGYEQAKLIRVRTNDAVSSMGQGKENSAVYARLKRFIDKKEYNKFDLSKLSRMGKEEKFEYFRDPKNAERYSCFVMLSENSDKLLKCMRADGFLVPGSAADKELSFKCSALADMRKGFDFAIDKESFTANVFASGGNSEDMKTVAKSFGSASESLRAFDRIKSEKGLETAAESLGMLTQPKRPDVPGV